MTSSNQWLLQQRTYLRHAFSMGQTNNGMIPQRKYWERAKRGMEMAERFLLLKHSTTEALLIQSYHSYDEGAVRYQLQLDSTPWYKFRSVRKLKYKTNQFQDMAWAASVIVEAFRNLSPPNA